ncbi:hypothetical protein HUE57_02140 [Candidatus Reidiella endopervernicosa]|uniref:Uncharacterized protein n=2 Tax=Candidatus Reidiella endopervernicosa TaxID=2738883 RepID=A0A6N0HS67_9GAMM|nr:hypothetical protein HUE57_02140 [Candidatus Reidiella endopervernicosa]
MPFPMQVILIVGATGYLLTALLFFIARTMPRTNPGAGWWGLSSLAAGTGYIALLVLGMSGRPELGEALYNTLFVVWIVSLYIGGSQFLYLKVNTKTLLSLAAVVVLWLSYFNHIQPEFLPAAVAVSLFCGLLNLHLAWLFATKMVRNSAIKKHWWWRWQSAASTGSTTRCYARLNRLLQSASHSAQSSR